MVNNEKLPFMHKWESECNLSFSIEDWKNYIINLRKCTRLLTVRETATQLFTRWYYTPTKLHAIFPSVPQTCFRGCTSPGSFSHIFWEYEKISQIWRQLETFASISENHIHLTLSNCLLFTPISRISIPT